MTRLTRPSFASAIALLAILTVACNPEGISDSPSSSDRPVLIGGPGPGDGLPNFEAVEVCKFGSSADISVGLTYPSGPSNATHTLVDGGCLEVGQFDGPNTADIAIQEANLPAGIQFDSVRSTVIFRHPAAPNQVTVSTTNSFNYVGADNHVGILVEFFNSVTPPPPPGGGEGCTPGYWKQSHHFDSWVGYTPDQLFSTVFENAFPGQTLVDVASNGGGGLQALGRHAVAALLNSANGGVSYDLTTAEVINSFNAVFPGSKNSYNALKDQFEGFNQQGCPLN